MMIALYLTRTAPGRIVLHLVCMVRGRHPAWHWRGIVRECRALKAALGRRLVSLASRIRRAACRACRPAGRVFARAKGRRSSRRNSPVLPLV